jgi:hypothetical protein
MSGHSPFHFGVGVSCLENLKRTADTANTAQPAPAYCGSNSEWLKHSLELRRGGKFVVEDDLT